MLNALTALAAPPNGPSSTAANEADSGGPGFASFLQQATTSGAGTAAHQNCPATGSRAPRPSSSDSKPRADFDGEGIDPLADSLPPTDPSDEEPISLDAFSPLWPAPIALLPAVQAPPVATTDEAMLAAQAATTQAIAGLLPAVLAPVVSPDAGGAGDPAATIVDSLSAQSTFAGDLTAAARGAVPNLTPQATIEGATATLPPASTAGAAVAAAASTAAASTAAAAASAAATAASAAAAASTAAAPASAAVAANAAALSSSPATTVPRPGASAAPRRAADIDAQTSLGSDASARPALGHDRGLDRGHWLAAQAAPALNVDNTPLPNTPASAADSGTPDAAGLVAVADAAATPTPALSGMGGSAPTAGAGGFSSSLSSAPAAQTSPREAQITAPVLSPEFGPALGLQISALARDGTQQARLHLNPAELGPITVTIALDGLGARVDFQADASSTRAAIEASLPALAGALREAGLTLTGGGVFQQPQGRPSERDGAQPQGRQALAGGPEQGGADIGSGITGLRTRRGLVDLVA